MPDAGGRPPTGDLSALRRWLIEDPSHAAKFADDLLTPRQVVAEYPQIASSPGTLANWRSRGDTRLPWIDLPTGIYYRRLAVLDFIEARTVRSQRAE